MRGSSGRRGEYLYRDTTRIEKSGECCQDTVHAENIENQIVQWLRSVLANIVINENDVSTSEQIAKVQSRYDRVKTLFIADQIDNEIYVNEKERYENGLALLQKTDNDAIITSALEIQSKISEWQRLTDLEKRRLLQVSAEAVYIKGSVLVGVQPTFALLPLTTLANEEIRVGNSGPDGDRTRGA